MQRIQTLGIVIAIVTTACSAGGSECATFADDNIAVFQEIVDSVETLDPTDFPANPNAGLIFGAVEDDIRLPLIGQLEAVNLDARAAECDDQMMVDLIVERLDSLQAATDLGATYLEDFKSNLILQSSSG